MNKGTYCDINKFSGFMKVFEKPDGLSWQREYRLAVTTVDISDPFYIEIGDIRDITVWGKVDDLKKGYIVNDLNVFIPNLII